MYIRRLTAMFLILGISHAAKAAVFQGECNVVHAGNAEVFWETELDTKNNEIVQTSRQEGDLSVVLTITPGAAAFADVMTVKVETAKTEFELMSLLSNSGYGSVIYNGKLDGEKFSLECVVSRTHR